MFATALLDGAGRSVATVGGVEFYLNQGRVVMVDEATVRAVIASCDTWVWVRGSKTYHTDLAGIPPECSASARPLRDFLLCGPMEEVISRLAGTWVAETDAAIEAVDEAATATESKTPVDLKMRAEPEASFATKRKPKAATGKRGKAKSKKKRSRE